MTRRDLLRTKLRAARRELLLRRKQQAAASRGYVKIIKRIRDLEARIEKRDMARAKP